MTTVSRKEQTLFEAGAAVFVVTREDIRRSGATCIPEALRAVPGVQVGRIGASKWAVSVRGFNAQFANKLLMLIDGRSVYTPLSSGVFWDVQDVLLEDVNRIEIIRGPGAALWGANAVNGIINIITEPAADSRAHLVKAGGGTEERVFGTVRRGGGWARRPSIGSTANISGATIRPPHKAATWMTAGIWSAAVSASTGTRRTRTR